MRSTANQSTNSSGRFRLQRAQHVDPTGHQHFTAPGQTAAHRFDARSRGAVEFVGVGVEALAQPVAQLQQGAHQPDQRVCQLQASLADCVFQRVHIAFEAVETVLGAGTGIDLLAQRAQENLGRTIGFGVADARHPAGGGQGAGSRQRRVEGFVGEIVIAGDQIAGAFAQAPRAARGPPASAFRPEQPAAQFGGLLTRQTSAERGIGGVEQMVAFVEHIARRQAVIIIA